MSDHGSLSKAILYALIANFGIAVSKLLAALYTASGSMMAEAIHSFSDCANQILLFIGLRQSKRPPSREHPLGFGKVAYLQKATRRTHDSFLDRPFLHGAGAPDARRLATSIAPS